MDFIDSTNAKMAKKIYNQSSKLLRFLFIFYLVFDALQPALCQTPKYLITDLGIWPGDTTSSATRLNNVGDVVVQSTRNQINASKKRCYPDHTYLWQQGKRINLGAVIDVGLNDKGNIVYADQNNRLHLWQKGYAYAIPLFSLAAFYQGKSLINNRRIIVGETFGRNQAVNLWQNDHIRPLIIRRNDIEKFDLFSSDTVSEVINNEDQLLLDCYVKQSKNGSDERAFLWSQGQLVDIGTISSFSNTVGVAMNDHGWIVGNAFNPPSSGFAFVYRNRHIQQLPQPPKFPDYVATGINNSGDIVGSGTNNTKTHAFLWHYGKIIDLNSLVVSHSGWVLEAALAINSCGQIVGSGKFKGSDRAFLLTPILKVHK